MPRRAVALLALLAAVVLAGCGGDSDQEAGTSPGAPSPSEPVPTTMPPASTTSPPAPVPDILEFTAQTVAGDTFDGGTLAGKPAVLWFWAPWCPVCKRGAGDVVAAATELGDQVNVVGVAGLSGSVDDMRAFVEETGAQSVSHIADVDGTVYTRFEVVQQDTFAFISTDGTVELVDAYGSDPDIVGIAREQFGL